MQDKPMSPEIHATDLADTSSRETNLRITWTVVIVLGILLFGSWIRLQDLGRMAYHHDESIHAYYSWKLYNYGPYADQVKNDPSMYDPTYHGPLLYHLGALSFFLFGDSDFAGRLPFAVVGIFTLFVGWQFRHVIGRKAALLLLLLLAVSPAMTYFARFARNDVYVGAWNLAMLYCGLRYFQSGSPKEKNRYLWGLALFLSLHYATKENSYAHGLIYCSFIGLYFLFRLIKERFSSSSPIMQKTFVEHYTFSVLYVLYGWFSFFMFWYVYLDVAPGHQDTHPNGFLQPMFGDTMKWFVFWMPAFLVLAGLLYLLVYLKNKTLRQLNQEGTPPPPEHERALTRLFPVAIAVVIVLAVYTTLFTTLFANSGIKPGQGLRDGVYEYLAYWAKMHHKPRIPGEWWYYLPRLGLYETLGLLTLVLASVTYLIWFVRGIQPAEENKGPAFWPLRLFLIYYSLAAIFIYGQLQEKVPWLLVHQVLPLILLTAVFFADLRALVKSKAIRVTAFVLFGVLAAWGLRNNILLNCYNNEDPREIMVFTQTDFVVTKMLDEIDEIAYKSTKGLAMPISVSGESQWPFSWYLRNYSNMSITPNRRSLVIIADKSEEMRMQAKFGGDYTVRTYDFRSHWSPDIRMLMNEPNKFWQRIIEYVVHRKVWSGVGSPKINFYVKKEIVPVVEKPDYELPEGAEAGTRTGKFVNSFGRFGKGPQQFNMPRGLDAGPEGNIYVCDSQNFRIQKFAPDGTFLLQWGEPGTGPGQFTTEVTGPSGIAVSRDGFVYVTDMWNHRIQKFDSRGRFLSMWGTYGTSGDGVFYGPRDVAVDARGNVYVADTGNKRIQVFDPDGRFIREFGGFGALKGEFEEPVGVAIGPDGNVYVADTGNRRVQVLTPQGRWVRQVHLLAWNTEYASTVEPFIAVDSQGRVYVTDSVAGVVHQISSDGKKVVTWGTKGSGSGQLEKPSGIAVAPDGDVYVADRQLHRISVFKPH